MFIVYNRGQEYKKELSGLLLRFDNGKANRRDEEECGMEYQRLLPEGFGSGAGI